MEDLRWVAFHVRDFLQVNRSWMTWNLLLGIIPAVLSVGLFAQPRARTAGWWAGVVAFVLFLPNAPYVVTDLVHLGDDIDRAPANSVVLVGVLPTYALFIGIGFLCYLLALEMVLREVRRHRPTAPRWLVDLSVHALCAVGVILGRITRLNSWDTVANPRWTIQRTWSTLTWEGAPPAFLGIFLAIVITTFVVRALATRAWRLASLVVERAPVSGVRGPRATTTPF
jgi:uncharacterized membrane protein